ncbi:multiubiquitin domain-containing protein [Parvibaculum sp.]|uniref:multiubiquitin domain-containing protein n=1 Tax=Parvibaculum sp. TaxID=2024848 RepID=UPI0027314511|nr:multiubiquitin domain-containing protein [Parvibaculum sp.]MDP1628482.1 multiubiquitin domain-containing protein [Parvibaculum sp.]MDP2151814.1 multiubiquitin domain-containing protein [Parvibaculum sp.]MDP3326937.1 multiubiquitin domain-containing protein [Parvibaculum sp.]
MTNEEKDKKKTVTIVIDGTPYEVEKDDMTYVELVTLADPEYPQHPETTYSVTYKRGQGNKPEGTLSPGGTVKIKNGMVFNVSRTGQA